ncbi:MAG: DNA translocase FtsK 4TM domain-containing protein [Rhodospirillales bacterium]
MTRIAAAALLPEGTADFFRRRLAEIAGGALAACGLLLLAALISFDPADPSFNHATDAHPGNLLGRTGAHIADLLLHGVGVAGTVPAIALVVWGWRTIRKRPLARLWLRLSTAIAATVLLSAGLAALLGPHASPLAIGPGGAVGSLLVGRLDAVLAGQGAPFGPGLPAVAALAFGLAASAASLGLPWSEWRGLGRNLSGGAAAGRRMVGSARSLLATVSGRRERLEPRFGPAAATVDGGDGDEDQAPSVPTARLDLVAPKAPPVRSGRKAEQASQGRLDFGDGEDYRFPPLDLLLPPPDTSGSRALNRNALEQNARLLSTVLEDFGIRGEIVKVRPGPVVTLYELEPAPGIKSSRVIGLADDIARSMSAVSVRVAVIPGRNVIGIELPNVQRETVGLKELLSSQAFESYAGKLTLALGKDIGGTPVLADLARMPHLLIAGTTGSGKSVGINAMILSLLYQLSPDACKFILVDPKMLELSVYDGIPHLLSPVVTEPAKAVVALKWTVREMEERYRAMSQLGVRNIAGYNARVADARSRGEALVRRVQTGFGDDGQPTFEEQPLSLEPLPFIVVVVDEMADLMLVAGKDIEAAVQRLAQMARAAGIHLIMATQRPSVDVITGTIKANFPTRMSFHVTSKIDSRTILGEQGAEQLLGQGDMLYMATGGRITRVHGPFVSDDEVERVVSFLKSQGEPRYVPAVTEEEEDGAIAAELGAGDDLADELYAEAVSLVAAEGKASTSYVQRRLQIGYNRAARIIERMEAEGLVSKPDRVGRREVLFGDHARS